MVIEECDKHLAHKCEAKQQVVVTLREQIVSFVDANNYFVWAEFGSVCSICDRLWFKSEVF